MNLVEYQDRESLVRGLTADLAAALSGALRQGGRASLAVAGGSTPGPVFDALSVLDLDWSRVDVLLTDERWLPEAHDRSNTRLIRQRLLVNRAAAARLVPLYGGTRTPEDSIAELTEGIRRALPLSVVLLGMGADMHTASLFPGADKLDIALSPDAPPLVAMRAAAAPEPRVTLSVPVLNGAGAKHLMITGAAKRAALARAEAMCEAREAPIRAVMDDLTIHWAA